MTINNPDHKADQVEHKILFLTSQDSKGKEEDDKSEDEV